MDNVVVMVVPSESAADEAIKVLHDLDRQGAIELYASTVLARTETGTTTLPPPGGDRAGLGTALGSSVGALIGLIGGAAAGGVGAAVGGASGLSADAITYSGLTGQFIHGVATHLTPGKFAVVASLEEDWTELIDQAVAPLGAAVFRQSAEDVAVAQIRADVHGLKEELAHVDREIARSLGEGRAKLEVRRRELQAKHAARHARMREQARRLESTWEAKLARIREKLAKERTAAVAERHQEHLDMRARSTERQRTELRGLFP